MTEDPKRENVDDLSVAEKILRVQDLWDEIARTPRDVVLTEAQRAEAERRLLEQERNPAECASWEDVKRRLESGR